MLYGEPMNSQTTLPSLHHFSFDFVAFAAQLKLCLLQSDLVPSLPGSLLRHMPYILDQLLNLLAVQAGSKGGHQALSGTDGLGQHLG